MQIQFLDTRRFLALVFLPLIATPLVYADSGDWSLTIAGGVHNAQLSRLENQLYQSPFIGFGDLRENQTLIRASEPFRFDIPLKQDNFTPKMLASVTWWVNRRHGIVFGLGSWAASSQASQYGQMPTQGKMNDVLATRRSELSYAEYTLGWRFNVFHYSNFQLYSKLAFNEIFDIDYRESYVFHYLPGSDFAGFNKIASTHAQTAALLMLEYSLGLEYKFGNWLNIGAEFGFLAAERPARLRNIETRNDFASRDFVYLETGSPLGATPNGTAGYLPPTVQAAALADSNNSSASYYVDMPLIFSGWQSLLHIGIDF